jgi:hypothetical protein
MTETPTAAFLRLLNGSRRPNQGLAGARTAVGAKGITVSQPPRSMFGPKEIRCLQRCCVTLASDMARCIIREEVRTPDVPYGDSFSCVSYTDVRAAPENDQACLASITAYVVFTKQPNYLVSGKIVSEAHKDYSDSAALWKSMALSHCRDSAAMLSDFRAVTSARAATLVQGQGRDASSLQQLSSMLTRALSRTGSVDSFGSGSRRNSEVARVAHERVRTSRQGSFARDSSDHEPMIASAVSVSSPAAPGDNSSISRPVDSQQHAVTCRAGAAPASSSSMSNSKL